MTQKDLRPSPRSHIARRGVLVAGLAVAGGALWLWPEAEAAQTLSAPEALAQVRAGRLTLIDIRRPDEWDRTGVAEGAFALDMRRDDFEAALAQITGGDRSAAIALICARGVRSRRLASRLRAAGFTQIEDVSEGMEGSRAGPGWVARGLPVTRP